MEQKKNTTAFADGWQRKRGKPRPLTGVVNSLRNLRGHFHSGKARVAGHSDETQFPHSGWCDVPVLLHLVEVRAQPEKQTNKQVKKATLRCGHLMLSRVGGAPPCSPERQTPPAQGTTGQAHKRPHQPLFILKGNVKT